MALPSGKQLDIPPRTPAHALWMALRYLHADRQPVFVGKLATMMNHKLRQWKKPHSFMEASVQRFLRDCHVNSVADYLPWWIELTCGKDGVKRGHVLLRVVR